MSLPRAKYIIIEHPELEGFEVPIMFSEGLAHAHAAGSHKVVGAGFCSIDGHEAVAWGESFGLGVKSRGEVDAVLLRRSFATVKRDEPAKGISKAVKVEEVP